jgi:hypothetical protein
MITPRLVAHCQEVLQIDVRGRDFSLPAETIFPSKPGKTSTNKGNDK